MLTLNQVKLLEQKIEQLVARVATLSSENVSLKSQLEAAVARSKVLEGQFATLQTKSHELESTVSLFKENQSQIEEGILSALSRLNEFEDEVIGQNDSYTYNPENSVLSQISTAEEQTLQTSDSQSHQIDATPLADKFQTAEGSFDNAGFKFSETEQQNNLESPITQEQSFNVSASSTDTRNPVTSSEDSQVYVEKNEVSAEATSNADLFSTQKPISQPQFQQDSQSFANSTQQETIAHNQAPNFANEPIVSQQPTQENSSLFKADDDQGLGIDIEVDPQLEIF